MEQARLYNILINQKGEVCIILKPLSPYNSEIANPEIIYDGGENAVLYRNETSSVILDYIPKEQQQTIFTQEKILIVEYDIKSDTILKEYFAPIIKVKKMLDLGSDFVDRQTLDKELKELGLLAE